MPTSTPTNIDISKSTGLTIEWADGHRSHYELQYLRDRCPCASCGSKETHTLAAAEANKPATGLNPLQMYKPRLKMQDVEEVGHYALRFFWNDGHSTGIYSYDHLRTICPCPDCRETASERE